MVLYQIVAQIIEYKKHSDMYTVTKYTVNVFIPSVENSVLPWQHDNN